MSSLLKTMPSSGPANRSRISDLEQVFGNGKGQENGLNFCVAGDSLTRRASSFRARIFGLRSCSNHQCNTCNC